METDSQFKLRSKCGHDFIPVNHTDGSWEGAAGSLREGTLTGRHRRPVRWRVTRGLQVNWRRESWVGRVPRLVANRNVVLVSMKAGIRAGVRADMLWPSWRNGSFAQGLCAGRVSLARPSFECACSPHSASMSGLILCFTTESEARPEASEVAAAGVACGGLT